MDQNKEEQLNVAIQNLRDDLKEHRKETREDIKSLEIKTESWHEEVRDEFATVKSRLTTIETQVADRKTSWGMLLTVGSFIVAAATAVVMYYHK